MLWFDEAIPTRKEAVDMKRRMSGMEHVDTLDARV
jgi:hypothetical protein